MHDTLPVAGTQLFLASTWKRYFALSIDGLIVFGIVFLIWVMPHLNKDTGMELLARQSLLLPWEFLVGWTLLYVVYGVLFLKFLGATPGKAVFGLKVINVDSPDESLSWMQAGARTACVLVGGYLCFGVFQCIAFFNPQRRQLADYAAGTIVLQRKPRPSAPLIRPVVGWILIAVFVFQAIQNLRVYTGFHFTSHGIEIPFNQKGQIPPAKMPSGT